MSMIPKLPIKTPYSCHYANNRPEIVHLPRIISFDVGPRTLAATVVVIHPSDSKEKTDTDAEWGDVEIVGWYQTDILRDHLLYGESMEQSRFDFSEKEDEKGNEELEEIKEMEEIDGNEEIESNPISFLMANAKPVLSKKQQKALEAQQKKQQKALESLQKKKRQEQEKLEKGDAAFLIKSTDLGSYMINALLRRVHDMMPVGVPISAIVVEQQPPYLHTKKWEILSHYIIAFYQTYCKTHHISTEFIDLFSAKYKNNIEFSFPKELKESIQPVEPRTTSSVQDILLKQMQVQSAPSKKPFLVDPSIKNDTISLQYLEKEYSDQAKKQKNKNDKKKKQIVIDLDSESDSIKIEKEECNPSKKRKRESKESKKEKKEAKEKAGTGLAAAKTYEEHKLHARNMVPFLLAKSPRNAHLVRVFYEQIPKENNQRDICDATLQAFAYCIQKQKEIQKQELKQQKELEKQQKEIEKQRKKQEKELQKQEKELQKQIEKQRKKAGNP